MCGLALLMVPERGCKGLRWGAADSGIWEGDDLALARRALAALDLHGMPLDAA